MRYLVPIAFWITSWFVLISIFAGSAEWQTIDYIYTSVFVVTLLIPVAVNDWYLRPRMLNRGRYWQYFLLLIPLVLAGAFVNQKLFDKFIDYILPGYYFISYYDYIDIVKFFVAFVGLTTLIGLSGEWFQLQETQRRVVLLEKEKLSAEFKALASQVNPHFLFNSLTVLYTLALQDSKATPSAIIKLSDILRYVIYQSSQATVALASEATIIRDYIDLQRYRIHPSTKIGYIETISDGNTMVAPMLFLPLVENSFKHGVHAEIENAFVDISMEERDAIIYFKISNNKPTGEKVESREGIGLKNLKDRLLLIYPERHKFTVTETENTFSIEMQIGA
ncbi:MAG TPA: histidine kinase [Cyclobacteriaceae bacterium]|nr:histidine kinase [Cyclobacteriaceae bacterium]